jgi:hypothetical protein
MTTNLSADWAVFVIVGAFLSLIIYAVLKNRLSDKKSKKEGENEKDKM